jgi:hypothetical protein
MLPIVSPVFYLLQADYIAIAVVLVVKILNYRIIIIKKAFMMMEFRNNVSLVYLVVLLA